MLRTVDGMKPVDEVTNEVMALLEPLASTTAS
jgi:adenylate kinase